MHKRQTVPALGAEPDRSKIPTLRAVAPARPRAPPPPAASAPSSARTLSDSQVLKVLETRRADHRAAVAESPDVAVLPPEDTNTRLVLREAVALNAPVFFAVQLQWSVQPIDVKSVPRDPIFQAYSLYAAEGRRTGRTWFFLRVGFFNDALSAKQVAQYLRRNFASAAVVPVGPQERQQVLSKGRCTEAGTVARSPSRTTAAATS
jgi:hypothetical protein